MLDFDAEPDPEILLAQEKEEAARRRKSPRRALVVVIDDHADPDHSDTSRLLTELLCEAGFTVDAVLTVASQPAPIRQSIETAVIGGVDLVLTVGGTGVGARDHTPEATRPVLDQLVPGVAQALRSSGLACGAVDAAVSRGIAGVSGSTVVVNLAGSRAAIRDGMATLGVLVHHLIDELRQYEVRGQ